MIRLSDRPGTGQAVERSTDRELVLLARAMRTATRYRATLQVAEDPPHRITGNTIWPALRPAGTLVDVGGRRLALRDAGAGRPAVVLDAGLGWTSDAWGWVQDDIARFTRVVSYDRAGLGASDPAPTPRTSRTR